MGRGCEFSGARGAVGDFGHQASRERGAASEMTNACPGHKTRLKTGFKFSPPLIHSHRIDRSRTHPARRTHRRLNCLLQSTPKCGEGTKLTIVILEQEGQAVHVKPADRSLGVGEALRQRPISGQ